MVLYIITRMDWTAYRFFKFRYTVKPGSDPATGVHAFLALGGSDAVLRTQCMYISAGFETKGQRGLEAAPHWHFHFAVPNTGENELGNMRKRFQRWVTKDTAETRKGNFLYSLKEESDVKDIARFFRYPWKQGGRCWKGSDPKFNFERLPPELDIETQIALAMEEQARLWEDQIRAYEKKCQPDTRDLLFNFLDGINAETPFLSELQILTKICEFYGTPDEKGFFRSANKQTILGYLQTAKWKYGLETFSETAEKWLN